MADQNVTTTKHQQLDAIYREELIPDSTDMRTMMRYVDAINDVISSVDLEELSDGSVKQFSLLQYYLTHRLKKLMEVELGEDAA
jgi:hypothetical protein